MTCCRHWQVVVATDHEAATVSLRNGHEVVTFMIWSRDAVPLDVLGSLASDQTEQPANV